MLDCGSSISNALELSQSCIKPSTWNEILSDFFSLMFQGIQLGPTEASRYWIYWVPAQYVDAIKDSILGKWQFFWHRSLWQPAANPRKLNCDWSSLSVHLWRDAPLVHFQSWHCFFFLSSAVEVPFFFKYSYRKHLAGKYSMTAFPGRWRLLCIQFMDLIWGPNSPDRMMILKSRESRYLVYWS